MVKFEPTTPNTSQHVATGWPNARNMLRPTMLRYVALAFCDRLARALDHESGIMQRWNLPTLLELSPDQTIATCQRNMSQHCWAQHVVCVWPPCCNVLRRVGSCWLKFDHFQTSANNTQHVATHRNTVAKRTQHVAPNNVAICCVGMLQSFGLYVRWVVRVLVSEIKLSEVGFFIRFNF